MKDIRGKEIRASNLIAYPVRRGSFMELKLAHVAEVRENDIVCFPPGKSRRIVLKCFGRCVVVE